MRCSCPDYAGMCKHLAAVMYGIGNRLDSSPELLFVLRGVDHQELIEQAIPTAPIAGQTRRPHDRDRRAGRHLRHRNRRLPGRETADLENDHEEGPQGQAGPGRDEACHSEEGRPEESRHGEEGRRRDEKEDNTGFQEGVGREDKSCCLPLRSDPIPRSSPLTRRGAE